MIAKDLHHVFLASCTAFGWYFYIVVFGSRDCRQPHLCQHMVAGFYRLHRGQSAAERCDTVVPDGNHLAQGWTSAGLLMAIPSILE